MKLISCYISGFGKFQNVRFDFTSDLLVRKENNGWGKTTLADFIRCMLYGLDGGRTKSVRTNDRVRYAPWQGTTFGGSLTFSYGDRRFRVERTFGKTPAQDTARVFDENNMPCYDFGDKAERLGVMLFGMDSESYKKSVYIPQGEIAAEGVAGDLKSRLLALLNTGGAERGGADLALEKLDAADRALRAKRRPAKGKLDEIDEKFAYFAAKKADCEQAKQALVDLKQALTNLETDIRAVDEQLQQTERALELSVRKNEIVVQKQAYADARRQLDDLETERQNLLRFFGDTDPSAVNLEGIKQGVNDYYEIKRNLDGVQAALQGLEKTYQDKASLAAQEKQVAEVEEKYRQILGAPQTEPRGKKHTPKWTKHHTLAVFLGLVAAVVGCLFLDKINAVGIPLLVAGVLTMLITFVLLTPKRERSAPTAPTSDEVMEGRLAAAQAERQKLQAALSAYPADVEARYQGLQRQKKDFSADLAAHGQGIDGFLSHFRFEENFDYRTAVRLLEERTLAYRRLTPRKTELEQRIKTYGDAPILENEPTMYENTDEIRDKKARLSARKDDLKAKYMRISNDIEDTERRADSSAICAEEAEVLAEKERLEKRHHAILKAKEILLRARDNMATRYLQPVERGSKRYLAILNDEGSERLTFTADGAPLREESGGLREMDFYSAGLRELTGFCIRVALADALFAKEKPVLILDDPFVNLDDEKTEKAKRLVRELAKTYQVLYLTCKKERGL